MNVQCQNCSKIYHIRDEQLPKGKKISFPCRNCNGQIMLDLRSKKNPDDTAHVAKPPINESPEFSVSEESGAENFKEKVLRSVGDLPPMPEILIKAQKVMSDPNSSFQEIGRILETDQALAGRVLKLANSAAYGLSGMVSSIQHAAVVLGQKTLIEIVTVVGTSKFLGKQLNGYGLQHGDLWKHSLTVAFGSRIIARKKSPKLENDGFSAGLFHDAGKIVLDPYVLEKKKSFEEYLAGGQKTFSDAEKKILGFDHSEIAAELCKIWNIPDVLATAIRYHHHPFQAQDNKLSYILHMADSIALKIGIDTVAGDVNCQGDEKVMEFLNLKEEDVKGIMEEVVELVNKTVEEMNKS